MCPFCKLSVENEVHFVLCCPGLDDLTSVLLTKVFQFFEWFPFNIVFIVKEWKNSSKFSAVPLQIPQVQLT